MVTKASRTARTGDSCDGMLGGGGVISPAEVKRDVRRRDDADSRWLTSSWLAPAPVRRGNQQPGPEEGGIWRIAAGRTAR